MAKLTKLQRIERLPAYDSDSWGNMVPGDNFTPWWPEKLWLRRSSVLRILKHRRKKKNG